MIWYYPGQKKTWDSHACQRTGTGMLERALAYITGRAVDSIFGQGSGSTNGAGQELEKMTVLRMKLLLSFKHTFIVISLLTRQTQSCPCDNYTIYYHFFAPPKIISIILRTRQTKLKTLSNNWHYGFANQLDRIQLLSAKSHSLLMSSHCLLVQEQIKLRFQHMLTLAILPALQIFPLRCSTLQSHFPLLGVAREPLPTGMSRREHASQKDKNPLKPRKISQTLAGHSLLLIYCLSVWDWGWIGFFFLFCRTWTKRYLITSQTRVKRVSRIHHRTIQVRQNQKNTFRVGDPQAPFSISSSFILSFVLLPFFLNTKRWIGWLYVEV